jgi:flagellar protein FliO/FliZ
MRALLFTALVSAAQTVRAAGEAGASRAAGAPGIESLVSTLLGLALILALIFAGAWLVKRMGGLPAGGKGMVRILGGTSLGARERVVVVEVEGARLVLGVAPGRVQTLHVLPASADFGQALDRAREQAP